MGICVEKTARRVGTQAKEEETQSSATVKVQEATEKRQCPFRKMRMVVRSRVEKRTGTWEEGRDLATDWKARLMSRKGCVFYSVTEMAWLTGRGQEEKHVLQFEQGRQMSVRDRLLPSEWFPFQSERAEGKRVSRPGQGHQQEGSKRAGEADTGKMKSTPRTATGITIHKVCQK